MRMENAMEIFSHRSFAKRDCNSNHSPPKSKFASQIPLAKSSTNPTPLTAAARGNNARFKRVKSSCDLPFFKPRKMKMS